MDAADQTGIGWGMENASRPEIPLAREGWFVASLFCVALAHFMVPAALMILSYLFGDADGHYSMGIPITMSVIGVLAFATLGTCLHAILKSGGSTSWVAYLAWGTGAAMLIWHFFLAVISGGGQIFEPGEQIGQTIYLVGTAYVAGMSLITALIGWWFRYRWKSA